MLLLAVPQNLLAPHPAAAVLAPHGEVLDLSFGDPADRLQDLHLLFAYRLGVEGRGRLHRGEAQDLHEVVLDDVPQSPGLLVERAAPSDPYVLCDGDLDVIHVVLIPQRLEDTVGETQSEDVLHRLLAEIVIYPVDLALLEVPSDVLVQSPGALQIPPEQLLD